MEQIVFNRPASRWNEALPLGNGSLGSMVYGGIDHEKISLNTDTLWSGTPGTDHEKERSSLLQEVRELIQKGHNTEAQRFIEQNMLGPWNQSYMPLGDVDLYLTGNGSDRVKYKYKRRLDLSRAIWTMEYDRGDVHEYRESWISRPAGLMCYSISVDSGVIPDIRAAVSSRLMSSVQQQDDCLVLSGSAPSHVVPGYVQHHNPVQYDGRGMPFSLVLKIVHNGNLIPGSDGCLLVSKATAISFLISASTGYKNNEKIEYNRALIENEASSRLRFITLSMITQLKRDHIKDYGMLYNRVSLKLTQAEKEASLEELLEGDQPDDEGALIELFFNYGRYLLISSSRPGCQPSNLQGIWSYKIRPDWSSNWTININTQMNYWPAEVLALSECHEPLFDLIEELKKDGIITASCNYGCRGWCAHHNVDIWKTAVPVGGSAQWAFWPMGGLWLCQHLWTHYDYTRDIQFLEARALPAFEGASRFILDFLVHEREGFMTLPSTSPENNFLTESGDICAVGRGSTIDLLICREVLENTLKTIEICGRREEFGGFIDEIETVLGKLCSPSINSREMISEWYDDVPYHDPGHRHFSPLYGLYPGDAFFQGSDADLKQEACRRLLEERLSSASELFGWSCAWAVSMYARLRDGEGARKVLCSLLYESMNPVLLSDHPPLDGNAPPFEIDGNFGGTAGIAEMLLQSHGDYIDILPALPEKWSAGECRGWKARGGFTVSFSWNNHRVSRIEVRGPEGAECFIRTADRDIVSVITKKDNPCILNM